MQRELGALREEAAHERQMTLSRGKPGRAPQHAQSYRGTLYRVSKHQIRRCRRAARSSMIQGSAEPLCARIKGASRVVLWEKLISDHGLLSSYKSQQGAVNGQDGHNSGMPRALADGRMLARAPASPLIARLPPP